MINVALKLPSPTKCWMRFGFFITLCEKKNPIYDSYWHEMNCVYVLFTLLRVITWDFAKWNDDKNTKCERLQAKFFRFWNSKNLYLLLHCKRFCIVCWFFSFFVISSLNETLYIIYNLHYENVESHVLGEKRSFNENNSSLLRNCEQNKKIHLFAMKPEIYETQKIIIKNHKTQRARWKSKNRK